MLYEKYAAGSITKEAYIQQKAAADVKIAENDGAIQRSHERMKELDSETACSDESWMRSANSTPTAKL